VVMNILETHAWLNKMWETCSIRNRKDYKSTLIIIDHYTCILNGMFASVDARHHKSSSYSFRTCRITCGWWSVIPVRRWSIEIFRLLNHFYKDWWAYIIRSDTQKVRTRAQNVQYYVGTRNPWSRAFCRALCIVVERCSNVLLDL